MPTENTPPHGGLFKRLLAPFMSTNSPQESGDDPAVQEAYESVTRLNALVAEMARLRSLRNGEAAKGAELEAERGEIEGRRIAALTEYKVSGDAEAKKTADKLLKRSEEIAQQQNDCQAVAASIQARIDALETDKRSLKQAYQRDLGQFLERVFARTCEHYSILAPEVAEAALQMAAVQNVMLRYLSGNSNGFERRIYLPRVNPGNGASLAPLLDGDTGTFAEAATVRAESIIAEMKQAGFSYRFN